MGVSNYEHIESLRFATEDARALSKALEHLGFEVSLLIDPRKHEILEALNAERQRNDPEGQFWFYFSGHGAASNDEGFIIAADSIASDLQDTSISMRDIGRILDTMPSRGVLAIFDAVVSGAAHVQFSERPPNIKSWRALITAASPGQSAVESEGLGHGLFTYALLEGLTGRAANVDGDITLQGLFAYVSNRMAAVGSDSRLTLTALPTLTYAGPGRDFILANTRQ
jgi:uncharacterized caspase-like protein